MTKKSRMGHGQMESNGSWVVMVSIAAKDKYHWGGVSHELHVHSLKSDIHSIGNDEEMHIRNDLNDVVGIPCINIGTVAKQTGMKEVGM